MINQIFVYRQENFTVNIYNKLPESNIFVHDIISENTISNLEVTCNCDIYEVYIEPMNIKLNCTELFSRKLENLDCIHFWYELKKYFYGKSPITSPPQPWTIMQFLNRSLPSACIILVRFVIAAINCLYPCLCSTLKVFSICNFQLFFYHLQNQNLLSCTLLSYSMAYNIV